MIKVLDEKVSRMPLSNIMLQAMFEVGGEDMIKIAALFGEPEKDVRERIERKFLIDGMTVGIAAQALDFIPDVMEEHRTEGKGIRPDAIVSEAIDMACIYVTNCHRSFIKQIVGE